MKTSMIGQDKKKEDGSPLSSIASMLTSFVGQAFSAKLAQYQDATVEPDSPFHGLAFAKFLQPLGGLAAKLPVNLANAKTFLNPDQALSVAEAGVVQTPESVSVKSAPAIAAGSHESLASLKLKSADLGKAQEGLPYQDIVQEASNTYNVPVALVNAVIKQESAFKPDAKSHCGAMGLMQLMPATAKAYGCNDGYDPQQNIMAGTRFLGDLLKRYQGDVTLATAAYNAGPGNVAKYGQKVPPFKETQNYVVKVRANYEANLAQAENTVDKMSKFAHANDEKKLQKTLG